MKEHEIPDKALEAAAVLIERISESLYRSKGPGEIQPLQWAIMRCLARHNVDGLTQSWIAKYLGLTHGPVSRAISTLSSRGLVIQTVSADDARSKVLKLSTTGLELMKYDPLRALANSMKNIDESDFVGFSNSLEKLVLNIAKA